MEQHDSQPNEASPCSSRVVTGSSHSQFTASKTHAGPLPGGLDFSPEKRRWPLTQSSSYKSCQRLLGLRNIEPLFEKKYLVNRQALLSPDLGSPAQRRLPCEDATSVDKANPDSHPARSALDPRPTSVESRKKGDKKSPQKVVYTSPPPSSSEESSPSPTMTNFFSQRKLRCKSESDRAAKETNHQSNESSNDSYSKPEYEHLFARKPDDEPVYACMEKAVDLFLDHNKLLEDIQRVQPVGIHEAIGVKDVNAPYEGHTAHGVEAAAVNGKVPRRNYAAHSLESRKDVAGQLSPSDWTGATTPGSKNFVTPAEVDESAVGALNSVSTTRVSGTQAGSHVVLTALEWERFKRTVTNLISANLELQRRLRLTQRHFRSLGYSGNLEQTLAKLKSEELRVRREMALRQTQFADSFALSAKLQQHKNALTAAEQGMRHLKDQAQKIANVKELLKQVKGRMQPQGLQGAMSNADGLDAIATTSLPDTRTNSLFPCAIEPPQRVSSDVPRVEVRTPYVEIHRCVRVAANKCFIVCLFAPAEVLKQQSTEQQDDAKAADEPSKLESPATEMEPVSSDQREKCFAPCGPSTMSESEPPAVDTKPAPESHLLTLKQVEQLFLQRQMEETISCNLEDILLVVYNGETSDANIQRLRLDYPSGSARSRPAVLRAFVKLICRNLRLSTLPFEPDDGQTNGKSRRGDAARYTLKYTQSAATKHVDGVMKEKTRVVLRDQVDETSIHDAEEDLLYVGCHAMNDGLRGTPRHYLIRLYRCSPRYLVARVFSPRSAVLHSCWIDAHWAMQTYHKRGNITSTPLADILQKKTDVVKDVPCTPRGGGTVSQNKAVVPLSASATPRRKALAAPDVQRVDSKKELHVASEHGDKDVEGSALSSETALTPSFIRFVASSLAFDQGKLCFRTTEVCGMEGHKQQLSVKRGGGHHNSVFSGGSGQASRCPSKEQHKKSKRERTTDSTSASKAPEGADINDDFRRRLRDIRERQGILQRLSQQTTRTSSCSDTITVTHAQIVQRSSINQPTSYKSYFMLIRSCAALTLSTVTFVLYEPASSWCAESSFSLRDALALLCTRERTFLQRLAVDKSLLKELLSAAARSSTATDTPFSSNENGNGRREKVLNASRGGWISPRNASYSQGENLCRIGSSRSPRKLGASGEVTLVHTVETRLAAVGQLRSAELVSECSESQSADAAFDTAGKRIDGNVALSEAEKHFKLEMKQPHEEESGVGTGRSTVRTVGEYTEGMQLEEGSRANPVAAVDLTKSSGREKQKDTSGAQETFSAAGPVVTSGEQRSTTSDPPRTEVLRLERSAGELRPHMKRTDSGELQQGEPDIFVRPCVPSKSAQEQNREESGATKISGADVVQNHTDGFQACVSLPTAEGDQRQHPKSGMPTVSLSEAQWRSLLQEIFVGLKVSGDEIMIPGLSMMPVPGLWKNAAD